GGLLLVVCGKSFESRVMVERSLILMRGGNETSEPALVPLRIAPSCSYSRTRRNGTSSPALTCCRGALISAHLRSLPVPCRLRPTYPGRSTLCSGADGSGRFPSDDPWAARRLWE